jgi:DNA-binding transcriptional MerR regulator
VIETDETESAGPRRPVKSEAAFRTISEVSEDLDVPQHVLRFWESKFSQIKPLKRGGGRRYYRPEDLQLLKKIRDLLYKDGYTIRGVQKLLREQSRGVAAESLPDAEPHPAEAHADFDEPEAVHEEFVFDAPDTSVSPHDGLTRPELAELLDELSSLRDLLRSARKTRG